MYVYIYIYIYMCIYIYMYIYTVIYCDRKTLSGLRALAVPKFETGGENPSARRKRCPQED